MVRLLLNHLVDFTLFSLSENGFELVLYISNDVFIHRLMSKSTMNKNMTMWRKRQLRSSSPPHRELPSRPKVLNRNRPSWIRKLKTPIDRIRQIVFHRAPRQTQYLHCHHYSLLQIGKGSSFNELLFTLFRKLFQKSPSNYFQIDLDRMIIVETFNLKVDLLFTSYLSVNLNKAFNLKSDSLKN